MDESQKPSSIEPLCDLLVAWAGQGAMIIDHMVRSAGRAPDEAAPVDAVFHQIVRSVLEPLRDRHPAEHLVVAADVLLDAQRTLADEILLVDLADPDTNG